MPLEPLSRPSLSFENRISAPKSAFICPWWTGERGESVRKCFVWRNCNLSLPFFCVPFNRAPWFSAQQSATGLVHSFAVFVHYLYMLSSTITTSIQANTFNIGDDIKMRIREGQNAVKLWHFSFLAAPTASHPLQLSVKHYKNVVARNKIIIQSFIRATRLRHTYFLRLSDATRRTSEEGSKVPRVLRVSRVSKVIKKHFHTRKCTGATLAAANRSGRPLYAVKSVKTNNRGASKPFELSTTNESSKQLEATKLEATQLYDISKPKS